MTDSKTKSKRRFSSYGPIDTDIHYYAPRKELLENAYTLLTGDPSTKGGHYITVWAPRQSGKSWLMAQILYRLQKENQFHALKINLEHLKDETDSAEIIKTIAEEIGEGLGKEFKGIDTQKKFQEIFKKGIIEKPLILILDEFDALTEEAIGSIVGAFRNIHIKRMDEIGKTTRQKAYLLHSVALIGVRSVLGIENVKGSPFNVQRSVHIPNLTLEEVTLIFDWYKKESGQNIDESVVLQLYNETRGQPGLTCWFGELLTDTYNREKSKPITIENYEEVHAAAVKVLPNNNILNIISKADKEPYKQMVLELFKTDRKMEFTYDNKLLNHLYMNGVIDREQVNRTEYYARFSSPFVQKRLFNYFSTEMFRDMGKLYEPFDRIGEAISENQLNIKNIILKYQAYFQKNKEWLLENVPRRKDLRVYEAVYHFSFYSYLNAFLKDSGGRVIPEFPTGNGKIDLLIFYKEQTYGIELKSFTNERNYKEALIQAAKYGHQLKLEEITLLFFLETIDNTSKKRLEIPFQDQEAGINVHPIFVETQIA